MSHSERVAKMAAFGDYESVLPFQAVGVEPFFRESEEDISGRMRELAMRYAVIFVVEDLFEEHQKQIHELNEEFPVSIIPIPNVSGSRGLGMENIRSSVEQAIGMDIFSVGS
ncbi:MAG TPA: V-type ATP synthase subunit F [Synergistaceae bacterium]|nr:V-type ATP synthase subunit F [Synergistaceae bacterium]HPJ26052.1 V-type ATP synthase subunit F [Synergistaceae bacterium]HPQ38196.1 V-type ATP synthase subunit F [Synergistaceae bacterium]